jgi:hypothetical protein
MPPRFCALAIEETKRAATTVAANDILLTIDMFIGNPLRTVQLDKYKQFSVYSYHY